MRGENKLMATEPVELAEIRIQVEAPAPLTTEPRSQRLRALELVLVMSVAFAPLIFNSAWAYFLQVKGGFSKPAVVSLMLHEILALGVLGYVLSQQRRGLRDIGITFKFADVGMGVLLALGGAAAAASVQSVFLLWRPISGTAAQNAAPDLRLGGLGLVAVLFVLLNPVFEELLVRGYLISELTLLARARWIPAVASALLQGSYHLYQGIPATAGLTACFLLWSFYFYRTRRLVPVIVAHLCGDALALLGGT
jgi:membrane protease YdiL (CAAX protease family)